MKKEYADYSTLEVVIYKSQAIYNGKYVPNLKASATNHFRTSLINTIETLDRNLKKSEKIFPLTKNF